MRGRRLSGAHGSTSVLHHYPDQSEAPERSPTTLVRQQEKVESAYRMPFRLRSNRKQRPPPRVVVLLVRHPENELWGILKDGEDPWARGPSGFASVRR